MYQSSPTTGLLIPTHIYSECTQLPDEGLKYSGRQLATHALSYCDTVVRQTINSTIIT